ncbi:hypothetical protein EVAR_74689_1 [Eumeta japonica]|uniref:Uncharacterized protein n=1 Tax=Eumeta variegata TaxID=151549 RepID=A0A4C1YP89_EUMVA|nr:hypothetical protein EVAR_74689_1 [Eumeta japonica]
MEQRLRGWPSQFSALIDFMERHGDLSKPQPGLQGRLRADLLWRELTILLNSVGGDVRKSEEKWKKVWADWKTKTKKKFLMQQHASSTSELRSRQSLTALEKRVVALLGISAVVDETDTEDHELNEPSQPSAQSEKSETQFVLEIPHAYNSSVLTSQSQPSQSTPLVPPSPSSPPLPRSPPPQASASSRSFANSPRRRVLLASCRNCKLIQVNQAASKFVAVEQRRLELEEARDKRLHEREEARDRRIHEREMGRLRLESQQIQVTREHNQLLQQLCVIAQKLVDTFSQQKPSEGRL